LYGPKIREKKYFSLKRDKIYEIVKFTTSENSAKVKEFYRRSSDPDLTRIPASERQFDGKTLRNLKNTEEQQIDEEKIPIQNEPQLNSWRNIENMKKNIRELQQHLRNADNKNQKLRLNQD